MILKNKKIAFIMALPVETQKLFDDVCGSFELLAIIEFLGEFKINKPLMHPQEPEWMIWSNNNQEDR